jgi:hypothetical protein
VGDRLENDHREVYNGSFDHVSRIDLKEGELPVEFDGNVIVDGLRRAVR